MRMCMNEVILKQSGKDTDAIKNPYDSLHGVFLKYL